MTSAQKVIKYLAIAFAIFLILTIISAILSGIYGLTIFLGVKKENENIQSDEMNLINFEDGNIETLDIDVSYASLTIKTGETLKAETTSTKINFKTSNGKLQVNEKNRNWFSINKNEELIVYIPKNIKFEKVKISAGAGKINIENLTTKNLSFELGAGETTIENLNVLNNCNIEGGAGKVNILSGTINNIDLDMGVGEANLKAALLGKNKIDAGIGSLNINVIGSKENYEIKADKGIGNIRIDGKEISSGEEYGKGENYIKINGGVGNININFE